MIKHEIDNIKFHLKTCHDLKWVKKYGTVFSVIDATGSGCISFGVADENGRDRYFIKIAGVDTVDAEISPAESVETLKNAAELYRILKHPALVELIEHYPHEQYYVAVFRWADGECLFDYWNFDKYDREPDLIRPSVRFHNLPADKKLSAVECIFSFMEVVAAKRYVAVDLYDGSLLYDFGNDRLMLCDIDLFRKQPAYNDMGEEYWGSKRLKAPEEYVLGAVVDERTNVFTVGALLFGFFGTYTQEEIEDRYRYCRAFPCRIERWELCGEAYAVVSQAINPDREKRYRTMAEFHDAFRRAVFRSADSVCHGQKYGAG